MVNFAARGGFRSGLAFSQPILQLQNEGGGLRNGGAAAKMGVFRRGGFRRAFRSSEMRGGLRNGTRVPKGYFAEGGMGL